MFLNDEEQSDDQEDNQTDNQSDNQGDNSADTTDWKAIAEAEKAEKEAALGRLQRVETKLGKFKTQQPTAKKEGFDYAEKAYLKASGINSEEFFLVEEVAKATGKSLDEVLESKYFQAELKERRETKATQNAIPTGTKRSGQSARDEVDYWIAKGELPPADQHELRQKVVNAKIKTEKAKSQFSDNPLIYERK
jgi:hypothetical protein